MNQVTFIFIEINRLPDNTIYVHQVNGDEEDVLMRKLDAVLKFIQVSSFFKG